MNFTRLDFTTCSDLPMAATIGFFDGLHLGHRHLISQLKAVAGERGLGTMAVTFGRHPREVLKSDYRPQLLTDAAEKPDLLRLSGLDACTLLDFTPQMAALTAREFMTGILRDRLGVKALLMGYDHHFGSDRSLGFADYQAIGRSCGIDVIQATPLVVDGQAVSSSRIRRLVAEGQVQAAARLLGRYYTLGGMVTQGHHVGRKMGFPTANLQPVDVERLIPSGGVYAAWAEVGGRCHKAMLNIGHRPTLNNGDDLSIEAHLFDFTGDLYGQSLRLHFVSRLRDERRFDSLESLARQIRHDAEQTLNLLNLCSNPSSYSSDLLPTR